MDLRTIHNKPLNLRIDDWYSLDEKNTFDVVVIGGGIHGAAITRLCSLNGLETALFEQQDYASGTSSRSSKMVHGGLRYLEMFDFEQVFEGIKAREDLFITAKHIVRPERFLIPLFNNSFFVKFKMSLGLTLYDLFVRDKLRIHRWIPNSRLSVPNIFANIGNLKGCFEYCDGLMDDIRLVIDNIVSARLAGALCLNYAQVMHIDGREGNKFVVVRDALSCKEKTITAKIVINCAGPWVRQIQGLPISPSTPSLRFSQGTHLLFAKPWNAPSLFLPLEEKGRYYFVWPHSEGTLVGTTEREVSEIPPDPQPLADEIEEILFRLAKDLPQAELNRSSLSYCFAGIRTLPVKRMKKGSKTSQLSRKHLWEYSDGVLSLFGGKYTTAYWTAFEGLKIIWHSLGRNNTPHSLKNIPLEATATLSNLSFFYKKARSIGISEHLIERASQRMGGNVQYLVNNLTFLQPISSDVALNGEVDWAFSIEQATNLRDVMRRRLGLEFRQDHGVSALDQISYIGAKYLPNNNFKLDIQNYQEAMNKLHILMGIAETTISPC